MAIREQDLVTTQEVDRTAVLVEEIIQQIYHAYFNPLYKGAWVCAISYGKDSTFLANCMVKALERVPLSKRTRPVYFLTTDTGIENPLMSLYIGKNVTMVNEYAKTNILPIQAVLVRPDRKHRYAIKVIGYGNPLPLPINKNRGCTDWFKLRPMQQFLKDLIAKHGMITTFLGVREAESQKRADSIAKYGQEGAFIFPKKDGRVNKMGEPVEFESHPIKHLSDDDVWSTLRKAKKFPWGIRFLELRAMYEGVGECPIQIDKKSKACGGNSRNGCVFCMMVNKEDSMLRAFEERGEAWAKPLNQLRTIIRESLLDANFRKPVNYYKQQELDTFNPFLHDAEKEKKAYSEAKRRKGTFQAYEEKRAQQQQAFDSVAEGVCLDSAPVYPNVSYGGYNLEGRIFLLKNHLYYQQLAGVEYITQEDIEDIKAIWKEEYGWVENEADLKPEPVPYFGALVLNTDYSVNVEETTIPNLTLYAESVDMKTGLGTIILHPNTDNKKIAPPRKNSKNKQTKAEYIAQLHTHYPKTINVVPKSKKRNHAFYVVRDWDGNERGIFETLRKAELKTGKTIPYYWMPTYTASEKGMDYWNTVTFVVCRPDIHTYKQACNFVDEYIAKAEEPKQEETWDWSAFFERQFLHQPSKAVRKELLLRGYEQSLISEKLRKHAGVYGGELIIAQAIRESIGDGFRKKNISIVTRICKGVMWLSVWDTLTEGLSPRELGEFLMTMGYPPQVIPAKIKQRAGVTNRLLTLCNEAKRQGLDVRKVINSIK